MTMFHGDAIDLPPIRVARCEAGRREPGIIVFNVRRDSMDERAHAYGGWLMSLEPSGECRCLYRSRLPVQGVRSLANGRLLVTVTDGLVLEMTLAGEITAQWHASGAYRDREPPQNALRVEAQTFHHGLALGPGENLLLLSMEMREYDDWPTSTNDPQAPRGRAKLIGDIVMEVRRDGTKAGEWRLLDLLDPARVTYGSHAKYWQQRGFPGSNDWCHANALAYDASDDSILVSLRTQDCIVKFDRENGALRWILGNPEHWRRPWSDKLLAPAGSLAWQFHQHDCSITPAGTILCFDNGNYRAAPFAPALAPGRNYSRAVEFAVDEAAGTVRQVWSYGEAPEERLFAAFQGGALRLPATGNTFITYGGICTVDGKPADRFGPTDIKARLIEVTPQKEIVLDLTIGGGAQDPNTLSVFRAELVTPALLQRRGEPPAMSHA